MASCHEVRLAAENVNDDVGRVKVSVNADGSVSFTYAPIDDNSSDGHRTYLEEALEHLDQSVVDLVQRAESLVSSVVKFEKKVVAPKRRSPPRARWDPFGRKLSAFDVAALVIDMTGCEHAVGEMTESAWLAKSKRTLAQGVGNVLVGGVAMEVPS